MAKSQMFMVYLQWIGVFDIRLIFIGNTKHHIPHPHPKASLQQVMKYYSLLKATIVVNLSTSTKIFSFFFIGKFSFFQRKFSFNGNFLSTEIISKNKKIKSPI